MNIEDQKSLQALSQMVKPLTQEEKKAILELLSRPEINNELIYACRVENATKDISELDDGELKLLGFNLLLQIGFSVFCDDHQVGGYSHG